MKNRKVALCLGPDAGGRFEIREVPRATPAPEEIGVAVAAASVNPIDVRRAAGYGRRLLSLMGAARFPMTLGNDFAGTVVQAGERSSEFSIGDRVYGLKPVSRDGSHASHITVKAALVREAPADQDLQPLAALPYCFVTMWRAVTAVGLTRENAARKRVLVHGAAGGLGRLSLQMLSEWGARATAVAKASDLSGCLEAGAAEAVDRQTNPFANLKGEFDATLNFASWDDERAMLACLRKEAHGHATTVHPLMQNFDEFGLIGGAWRSLRERTSMRSLLPKGAQHYGWILFSPDARALSEMDRLVRLGRLHLPIGGETPLRDVAQAFDHVRRRAPGRALLTP